VPQTPAFLFQIYDDDDDDYYYHDADINFRFQVGPIDILIAANPTY
jgi:hypothetical protein